jgi:hypothetical protein
MVIRIILILAVVVVAAVVLRGQGARHLAVRRLLLALFALVAIASILVPDAWSAIARVVGVGRGADLLLYALIVVFFSYVSTRFAKDRRTQNQLTALGRRVALLEAPPPRDEPSEVRGDSA